MQIQGGSQSQMYAMSARPTLSKEQLKEQAGQVFSQLDTSNKGYLEQADFAKALSGLSNQTASRASDESAELFKQLDADQDGKLTSAEFADSVGEQLYNGLGMQPKGRPPMGPPPQEDEGKTLEELTAMAAELTASDSKMAQGLQNIIDQFDDTDADGDGKVTMQEAMALRKAEQTAQSTASQSTEQSSEQKLHHTLMQLMKTYGSLSQSSSEQVLNVTA